MLEELEEHLDAPSLTGDLGKDLRRRIEQVRRDPQHAIARDIAAPLLHPGRTDTHTIRTGWSTWRLLPNRTTSSLITLAA